MGRELIVTERDESRVAGQSRARAKPRNGDAVTCDIDPVSARRRANAADIATTLCQLSLDNCV